MRFTLLTLTLLLIAAPLSAQRLDRRSNPLSLEPGQHIRLNAPTPDGPVVDGRVVTLYDDSFFAYVIEDGPRVIYARAYVDVDTIDVRRRLPRKSAHTGAVWGGYLGAAVGAIIGPFMSKTLPLATGESVILFSGAGGLAGAVAGAATGAIFAPGQWYRHVMR